MRLIGLSGGRAALDLLRGSGVRIDDPPVGPRAQCPAQDGLDASSRARVGDDADPVGLDLGQGVDRLERVFEAHSGVIDATVEELEAKRAQDGARPVEELFPADHPVTRELGRSERREAVFDLELEGPLALPELPPGGAQGARGRG